MSVKNRMPRWVAAMVFCSVTAVAIVGALALMTETQAAPRCICPDVYAPVVCDNGKTYPNLCVANCRHAKNCVPVIILPPPL